MEKQSLAEKLRRLNPNVKQAMAALWIASQMAFAYRHFMHLDDGYSHLIARLPFLVVLIPALMACFPLALKSKMTQPLAPDDELPPRQLDRATINRMGIFWIGSMLTFLAAPLRSGLSRDWMPILYRPDFLIITPLLIATVPFLFPAPPISDNSE